MTEEQQHNHLLGVLNPQNREGIDSELCERLYIGLTIKQILDWYYRSNIEDIPMMLKIEKSISSYFSRRRIFLLCLRA